VPAIATYAIGILVQVPFLAQSMYTGPLTEKLGGADISWIIGLAVPAVLYYLWASPRSVAPDRMVRMPGVETGSTPSAGPGARTTAE
jgi:nucleobase:cation symporter-1, NCS1 family